MSSPISTAVVIYHSRTDFLDSLTSGYRKSCEDRFLNTYKALYLGATETSESKLIRSAIVICPTHSEAETAPRLANYHRTSPHLNNLSDEELSMLLTTASPLGSGMGGDVLSVEVKGVPVFIKKIRLTAIEQQYPRSTSNLFDLPSYYQYGVGSKGFGVWREIAAHEMTTQWVLRGECQNFPLMYHARVVQRSTPQETSTAEELENRRRDVEYWNGSPTVGIRLDAVKTASADVVVFMEYMPQTLHKRLEIENENGTLETSLPGLEHELLKVVAFMKSRGFIHFDAHFHNVLASNSHVYFADFGLALSKEFDLSSEEEAFFDKHRDYDRYYVVDSLAFEALRTTLNEEERQSQLDGYAKTGKITTTLPPTVATIANRYGQIAVLIDELFSGLRDSKLTPYPAITLEREWAALP